MSLGKYKNKTEIYSSIFTSDWEIWANQLDDENELYYFNYYMTYDTWGCTRSCCWPEYSFKNEVYETRKGKYGFTNNFVGAHVDMDSVYKRGTQEWRDKIISKLFGNTTATTIKDFLH